MHASARTRAPRSWKKSCDGHRMQWFELGQSELCFGVEIVSARVLIAMMMPAGGLELKLLSACKMVLVRPCHGSCDRGKGLGTGPQILGCHLQLQGMLLWRFITCTGVWWQDGFMLLFASISG